jgi:hypothetical protein
MDDVTVRKTCMYGRAHLEKFFLSGAANRAAGIVNGMPMAPLIGCEARDPGSTLRSRLPA